MERRKNDVKTEGEYIAKILNRDIHEEFATMLRNELHKIVLAQSTDEMASAEGLAQVAATFPGCEQMQRALEKRGATIYVTSATEHICCVINSCHSELCGKVYPDRTDKQHAFAAHCVSLLSLYVRRRHENSERLRMLPQFTALLLNDISYISAFIGARFRDSNNSDSDGPQFVATCMRSLASLRHGVFTLFVEQQQRELTAMLEDAQTVAELARAGKRVSLFLGRLASVIRPVMLKNDRINMLLRLVRFVYRDSWQLLLSFRDIAADETDALQGFCGDICQLPGKLFPESDMQAAVLSQLVEGAKLTVMASLLDQSLVSIINCYRRGAYRDALQDGELAALVDAIFAASNLKHEFLRELRDYH